MNKKDPHRYDDIIDLPHFVSKNRKRMSHYDRAAQFAPFDALEGFDEEMLYFSEFSSGMLDIFLAQLRRQKCPVALKAVQTETNLQFTACELYRELSAEREAIARGQQAH